MKLVIWYGGEGYFGVVELALGFEFGIEEGGDASHGLGADVVDELGVLLEVLGGELAGVGGDHGHKLRGCLVEELVELLQVLVHFRYGLHHVSNIQINDI